MLTLSRTGITVWPLVDDPRAPATRATTRVQEMYDLHGLRPRDLKTGYMTRGRLLTGVLVGMLFPFVLVFTADLSLFGLLIPIVLAIAGGVMIWPWIARNLPDPPTHWLIHHASETVHVALVIGAGMLYMGAVILMTVLFMGVG